MALLVALGLLAVAPPAQAYTYRLAYSYSSGSTGSTTYFHQSGNYGWDAPAWYAYIKVTCRAGGWLDVQFKSGTTGTTWAYPRWSMSAYDTQYWSKSSSVSNIINYNANSNGCAWTVQFYQGS